MDVDSDCEAGGLSGQLLLRVGALMLRSPAHDACISLPDPLLDAAPQFYGGASQLGLFSTPDFITPQEPAYDNSVANKENQEASPPPALSPARGKRARRVEGAEEGAPPGASQGASQGGAGRPPRHGGTPFALSSGGLAPPFAAAAARARVLALKQKSSSPPSHRNVFLQADDGAPHSPDGASSPSLCSSRYRSDFKQLRQLGKGNFSSVFEVCSRLDGVKYAVKRSVRELHSPAERRAAAAEAQALAAAGAHPCVVRYFAAWWEEHRLHIQLELCGSSLGGRPASGLPLLPLDLASLLRCVSGALAHLHQAGIAHMDVKPDNVFLDSPGRELDGSGSCQFKLGDLGAASPICRRADSPGSVEGDARYLPPELLSGCRGALNRADVWSLGATAYELGRAQPLPQEGPEYSALRRGELQPLPGLPAELQRLLERCMSTYPAQRPSAAALHTATALQPTERATLQIN